MKSVLKIVLVGIGSSLACLGCGSGYSVIAMSSPSISQISPQVVAAGTPGVTLLVKGANFDGKSAIMLNGAAVPTSLVSSDTLSTQVSASLLAQPAVQQLQVQNSYGVTSNAVKLTVESPNQKSANTQLDISTTGLQAGTVGSPYSATLAATGGTSPYTWSVKTGSLPAGLSLSAAGVLAGTPTTPGNSTFTVQVKDSSTPGQTQTASLTLVIAAPVTTASPLATGSVVFGAGQVGVGYTATLNASGGTSPYTWWISAGSLPAGLTLSSAGVISGTPTASGTSNFTFSVHDSSSPQQTLSKNASITVAPANLAIVTSTVPSGTNGAPYSVSLAATGGTPAYQWSVSSGKLPTGLSLSSDGVISGTPTQNGNVKFTVSVQDSSSPAQSQSASFSIHVTGTAFSISSTTLASGRVAAAYSTSLSATGGTPGYAWSIASGSLPPGLTLSSTGLISGTPTATGTATFTVAAQDSSSPALVATASESITIQATQLSVLSTTLPAAKPSNAYSAALSATGGTPGYSWSIASGSLPAGLTLSSSGVISGSPTASGAASFTVAVKDSSSPQQTATATESITVAASNTTSPLTISSATLGSAQVATAYSATLQATGGTGTYTWSVTSGTLPAGLALSPTTGTISGTPTTSGTSSFTVQVADSSSPVQTQSVSVSIPVAAAAQVNIAPGTTWYVRPDGGTRYSSNATNGQCDGQADLPYPGTGVNQHCAFNDVRLLWQDGSYAYSSSPFPAWGWVGKGGDTYIIRGSIADGVSYRIGSVNAAGSCTDTTVPSGQANTRGACGDPYQGAPPPPSGTATQHTRVLGGNYASCSVQSARTQLHGGWGVNAVLDLTGASYVDVKCLDITDFSNCGRATQSSACQNNGVVISDYAGNGILLSNASTHITLDNIRAHGLASFGIFGPTGDGSVFTNLEVLGNAGGGWNADLGNNTTGTGTLLVQHFNISWNGCAEEYPIVDPVPYGDCTDQNSGGYGDGFGTTTVSAPPPGWQVHFDQGVVAYNTQDGLDALHLIGSGSSMTISRTLGYGNMGQQFKVGGASGTAINNVIVGNCNAMRSAIPGTPAGYNSKLSDFCRASDVPVVMTASNGSTLTYQFNTLYSANTIGVEVECDTTNGQQCNSTALIDFRNNVFFGFIDNAADGNPLGQGQLPTPIYVGETFMNGINPFTNAGSVNSNNLTYGARSGWACPNTSLNESAAICGTPNLTDPTWHLYGYGNMQPLAGSNVFGNGVTIPAISVDFNGQTRPTPPSIGAYE